MQGFLFSKALPAGEVETWLQQTILPRKAPWIGKAGESEIGEVLRFADGRDPRVKPAV